MTYKLFVGAVSLVIGLGLSSGSVEAVKPGGGPPPGSKTEIMVNCNAPGKTIQDAVDNATGPTTIFITGVCEESVTITKDDITLDGDPGGTGERGGTSTIVGPVDDRTVEYNGALNFDGAQRGVVQNMTVTGSGDGIVVDQGASVRIKNNIIDANERDGIVVINGSFVELKGNDITNNGRADFFESGICVLRGAVVEALENKYENNVVGISVYNFATYRTGSHITPEQPDNDGLFETINKGVDGLYAADFNRMSFVDLRQVSIRGDVFVGSQTMLQFRGDTIAPTLPPTLP